VQVSPHIYRSSLYSAIMYLDSTPVGAPDTDAGGHLRFLLTERMRVFASGHRETYGGESAHSYTHTCISSASGTR